jgi:recombination protein RecA
VATKKKKSTKKKKAVVKKKSTVKKKTVEKKKKTTAKKSSEITKIKKSPKISAICTTVQSQFNKELITTLQHERSSNRKVIKGISWGSASLNFICTGNPFIGIPFGRIIELYGKEGSAKTTLCLHAIAEAQALGYPCAFIDAEHALNLPYAQTIGVNLEDLLFSQPDYGEQGMDIAIALIEAGTKLVVVDSVVGLVPKDIIEGNMEKAHMARQARMMSMAIQKITALLNKNDCTVIFINQTREKPGVLFGSPIYTPGGNALKFFASLRMAMALATAKKTAIKGANATLLGSKEKERLGANLVVKTVKNKINNPFLDMEIPFYYGLGMDLVGDLYSFAEALGIIKKGKGSYILPTKTKGKFDRITMANLEPGMDKVNNLIKYHFDKEMSI